MLVLRTLQWGPQHGHGIGQAIKAQSDDLLRVETGSLYPALHRLEKQGAGQDGSEDRRGGTRGRAMRGRCVVRVPLAGRSGLGNHRH